MSETTRDLLRLAGRRTERDGRVLWCARPVGTCPEVARLVVEVALRGGATGTGSRSARWLKGLMLAAAVSAAQPAQLLGLPPSPQTVIDVADFAPCASCRIVMRDSLTLGDGPGAPGELMTTSNFAMSLSVAEDGTYLLSPRSNSELKLFRRDGVFLRTIGRRGEGPGELMILADAVSTGEFLYVSDPVRALIVVFSLDGRYLSQHRLPFVSEFRMLPYAPDPNRLIIAARSSDARYVGYPLHLLDLAGDSVLLSMQAQPRRYAFSVPRARKARSALALATAAVMILVFKVIDRSAGVQAVSHNHDLDGGPTIEIVEDLRIGSRDDPDMGFSALMEPVHVSRGDTLYVVEASVPEIRVYAPDGRLARRFGGRGEGPGEFRSITRWGVQGDTVWVIDLTQRRITLFSRLGAVISTVLTVSVHVLEAAPYMAVISPWTMRSDGRFDGMLTDLGGHAASLPQSPTLTVQMPRIIFDADGQPTDTVARYAQSFAPRGSMPTAMQMVGRASVPEAELPRSQPLLAFLGDSSADVVQVVRPVAENESEGTLTVLRITAAQDTVLRRAFVYAPRVTASRKSHSASSAVSFCTPEASRALISSEDIS